MTEPRTPHPYVATRFPHQLEMVHPSRERVRVPSLPPGYALRAFRDGDGPAYEELFRLAWPDVVPLAHTKAHALTNGFLLVEHNASGQLVASCVAFEPEKPRHEGNGSLGWLVVDASHGRRGLGAIVAATVTNRLIDEEYVLPWLGTEDDRLVAIGMYLSLGWQAYLYTEGMEARWREILARLGKNFSSSDAISP